MGKYRLAFCLLLGCFIFSPFLFAQEATTVPDLLRRPARGEAPRYPKDLVIGELGRREAPETAWQFAGELVAVLMSGSKTAPAFADSLAVLPDSVFEEIQSLEPRTFHLGGGKTETDGSVSFLIRFLGTEESLVGELYLRRRENNNAAADQKTETPVDEAAPVPAEVSTPAETPESEVTPTLVEASTETPPAENAGGEQVSAPPEIADAAQVPSPPAGWLLDDLVLDERKPLNEVTDSYRYDFTPYERFF
jgi:hypothetical protein